MYWGNLSAEKDGPISFKTHLSALECQALPETWLQFPSQYTLIELTMGYALKQIPKRVTMPTETVQWLYQLWLQGQTSGQKVEAEDVQV